MIEATLSNSKTEKMLNLISILNFTSLLLITRQVKYFKKVRAKLRLVYWSSATPVSPGRPRVKYKVKHIKKISWKNNENIGILILPRSSLLTLHKTFIYSNVDIIFDEAYRSSFHKKNLDLFNIMLVWQ